jgi:hypothetical protein
MSKTQTEAFVFKGFGLFFVFENMGSGRKKQGGVK